jgi:hypothetical protein
MPSAGDRMALNCRLQQLRKARWEGEVKAELEKQLCERYPLIFGTDFSFSCGDGWFDLIDVLCILLENETKHGGSQVVAFDVKEKFGTLRFAADGGNETQWGMIEMAEAMSSRICDVGGAPGKQRRSG